MYTLDASVHVSALNPTEADSAQSQAFLAQIRRHQWPLFCPTLLLVEVTAAVARAFGDAERAEALAAALRGWPNQTWIPLDEALADRAAHHTLTYFHLPERKRSVKSTARPIKSIPIASQMPVSARRGPSQ